MRILFVSQWFDPEPIFKGLSFVKALAARGHHVEVVTGFPNYPSGKIYPGYKMSFHKREAVDGIVVHRLALYPSHNASSIRRMINYLSFALTSAVFLSVHARRFDVIYSFPQVTVGFGAVLGGWIANRPVVVDIQDLWPDTVLKSGMRGTKFMNWPLRALCGFVYRRARRIVAQSEGIKERLIERGVPVEKVALVYNWADEEAAQANGVCDLSPYQLENRFNIVFGGNLGRVQGLDTLIRAACIAGQQAPQLHLLLIGDGMERENLESLVRNLNATNVTIAQAIPRMQIGDVFGAADVLILHLMRDSLFSVTVPSKTQFYLAMGKPILIGVEGEAASIVTAAGAGLAVPPQDDQAMAEAMLRMLRMPKHRLDEMGRLGRAAYWQKFSLSSALDRSEEILQTAVQSTLALR